MQWMEVIKLHTADADQERLKQQLTELIKNIGADRSLKDIKLFHNALADNDMRIHLHWKSGKAEQQGSATGQCLVHLLKEFGLTAHSVWIEEE